MIPYHLIYSLWLVRCLLDYWVRQLIGVFLEGITLSATGSLLSHILFANDTLIFFQATTQNCHNIVQLLYIYCSASGQEISTKKFSFFFDANTPHSIRHELCIILNMPQVDDPRLYLGMPTIWGRSKNAALAFVKEWVLAKIQGCKQSFLSQAGREVLIKAVVQAIPAYPMNLFRFPDTLCQEIDSAVARFWWGQKERERKIHWVNWETLRATKSEGEMGF